MKNSFLLKSFIFSTIVILPIAQIGTVEATFNLKSVNENRIADMSTKMKQKLLDKIPKKMHSSLRTVNSEQLIVSVASGLTEAILIAEGDKQSIWSKDFIEGEFEIQKVIPIFDLSEEAIETMLIFDHGYIIVDSVSGELVRYSHESVQEGYFEESSKLYSDGFGYFAIDEHNNIVDKKYSNKSLKELKREFKKVNKSSEKNQEPLIENVETAEEILDSIYYGANEGNGVGDKITDPKLWLLRYYPNKESGITNLSVTQIESATKSVGEINQDLTIYKEKNDCAVIATLEIINYHYGSQSQTNRDKGYAAMIKSSYFSSANGVYWYHNDDLFKVGAQAMGKGTQSTANDPSWKLGASYSEYKSYINSYGPSYLSINHAPYGAHTVTVKGYAKYKTVYKDRFAITRSFTNEFVRINDHWATTTGDAYLYLNRTASAAWYLQGITPD